jgi:putative methionine-R-sulfoxide reductase with GAF domain
MDLDSPLLDRFDLELEEFMTKIVELIQNPQG